jgi:hypothetical protein
MTLDGSERRLKNAVVPKTRKQHPKDSAAQNPAIAVYVRVSSKSQDTKSQKPDLERWLKAHADGSSVRWYSDHFTGKTMERKGWKRLTSEQVETVRRHHADGGLPRSVWPLARAARR